MQRMIYENSKLKTRGKVKFVYAMQTYGGSGGIAPPFLTSALDGDGHLHASAALPRYPLNRILGGPHRRYGRYALAGSRTLAVQPIARRYTD
jgi:hypothetical protein